METIPFSYAYAYAYVTPGLHSLSYAYVYACAYAYVVRVNQALGFHPQTQKLEPSCRAKQTAPQESTAK